MIVFLNVVIIIIHYNSTVYDNYPTIGGVIVVILALALSNLLILFARYKEDKKIKKILGNTNIVEEFLYPWDNHIDTLTKERYYKFLNAKCSGLNLDLNEQNHENIKKKCKTAVGLLKELTRDKQKYHLVLEENINIGFCKNTYGLKYIGIGITVILNVVMIIYYICNYITKVKVTHINNGLLISIIYAQCGQMPSNIKEVIICILINSIFTFVWTVMVRKNIVKATYEKYAFALLKSCDQECSN